MSELDSSADAISNGEILRHPIEYLNLSQRSRNCLKSRNCFHIGDLVQFTRDDLLSISNLGRKSLSEIERSLDEIGLTLGMKAPSIHPTFDEVVNAAIAIPAEPASPQTILLAEQLETLLEEVAFPTQFHKLINRISAVASNVVTIGDLINIDLAAFSELPTIGKQYVQTLEELKKQLPSLLAIQANKFPSQTQIEFNEIDNSLIQDVEGYLWTLDEMRMDIALSRWGFNHKHETLEEVANRYKNPDGKYLTRERIRQIEKPINAIFPLHLTIPSKILWANIRENMTEDLTALLPNLAKCFATDKLFYAFIELCCRVEPGSISRIIFTKIRSEIMDSLFCTIPSPIEQEIIINELMSNYGYDRASAIHGLRQLEKSNKIKVTERGISPMRLSRTVAVAHVLASHPEGLPWKDVAKIINARGCASSQIDETRPTHGFNDSEYIYLCGKGAYRNLIFLDLDQFDIPIIMQHLIDYLKQKQIAALHLHDYYYQTKGQRREIDYFSLRYLVREYGEEYGIYFEGKSSVDSVSLDPNSSHITQADVIIKALNESNVAMTKQEIAERLRSKSVGHASFYLDNLREEGRVVRVDKMVYTTPEKAFKDVKTEAIMQVIREILHVKNVIVEADVFREYVNVELNLSYSKYFYAALVNTQIEELGWHRNNMLFSKSPIPYKNLRDMCKQLCNPKLSNSENATILKQAVWLSDAVVESAIQQWRVLLICENNTTLPEPKSAQTPYI